jgi:hypothetical protein
VIDPRFIEALADLLAVENPGPRIRTLRGLIQEVHPVLGIYFGRPTCTSWNVAIQEYFERTSEAYSAPSAGRRCGSNR